MRKFGIVIPALLFICLASNAAFADDGAAAPQAADSPSGRLEVWSYSGEVLRLLNEYYSPVRPKVDIEYREIATDRFPAALDGSFSGGGSGPDVFALEEAFLRRYVESGDLLDLTDVANGIRQKSIRYPIEMATFGGKVYALTWQATPGAMLYRRSLAIKYLGTDDPETVQRYFADFDAFLGTARKLRDASGGRCFVVPSYQDLFHPMKGLKTLPWIGEGGLEIDSAMAKFLDLSKTLRDEGLELNLSQWTDLWFAGMRDSLQNRQGERLEVFSYFFPTWGLHYVLKTNAPDTSGDWAMIQGPSAWSWGGSWLAASKNTANPDAAKDLIGFLVSDDGANARWAKATGDLVTNLNAVERIRRSYAEPFLRGQNHYALFAEFAKPVTGVARQATDSMIDEMFLEAVGRYLDGKVTKAEALREFGEAVEEGLDGR